MAALPHSILRFPAPAAVLCLALLSSVAAAPAPKPIPDIRDSYGVALADFDQDGLLDVYLVGFRTLNRLLINNGDGTFRDQSIPAGVGGNLMPQGIRNLELGASAADYDNDGAVDLLICGWGEALDLLHNRKDGTFTSVTRRAGILRNADANMGLWGDLDGDGYLDLLLTNEAGPVRLYRNDRGWRFIPVPLEGTGIAADSGSQGGLFADFDLDGDLDLALAGWKHPLRLYEQTEPFRFREIETGLALPAGTRCNTVLPGDLDNDGDPDLLFTVRGGPGILLINQADPDRTSANLAEWKPRAAPMRFVDGAARFDLGDTLDSYGGGFADYDGDGDLDLFLTTRDYNRYYENTGGAFLPRALEEVGLDNPESHYNTGFMAGDLTPGPGDELFIVSRDSASSIQNGPPVKGRRLQVRLHGVRSNRQGVGSWVMLWSRGPGADKDPWRLVQSRQVHGGEGYLSSYVGPVSFHLDDSLAYRVRVRFPGGRTTVRKVAAADTLLEVWEGGFLAVAWARGSRVAYHALHDPVRRKAILFWILGAAAAAFLLRMALKAMAQSIARKQYTRELLQKNRELQELIEEVNRTQQQLIHSEKLAGLGQLVAGIAHELNNPIGFIYANLYQIRKYIDGIDRETLDAKGRATLLKMDQALRESQEGSIRIRDIVQNLRGLSRADSRPGHGLQKKPCDLNHLLDKSLLLAQTSFSKNISVEKDYAVLPPVEADETQVQQVFLNILVNAGQALGEDAAKGRIRLRTRLEGEGDSARAAVSIADDGPGIGAEQLKHIFEPFYTTKPVGQGIGLGLHICYEIISAHQGTIEALSEPGKGAEFLIKLPLGARNPNPPSPAPPVGSAQADEAAKPD
jgi:signal transduction histidine kinase